MLFQRAGEIQIMREKWEDARVLFIMCSEEYKSSFSFYNLGIAAYHLGEFDEAERVLSLVNNMDPSHAPTWAYLTLVLLKKEERQLYAAYQTMNEAYKLGLEECELMMQIFEAWIEVKSFRAAKMALEYLIQMKCNWHTDKIASVFSKWFQKATKIVHSAKNNHQMKEDLEEHHKTITQRMGMDRLETTFELYISLLCGEMGLSHADSDDFLLARL